MKKLFYLLLLLPLFSQAQVYTKTDSVFMTVGYANQVWYNLDKGTKVSAPKNNWDIAFEMTKFSAGIAINHATGTTLQVYPGGNITNWANSIDTNLFASAPLLYNTDTSWSYGAFNQNRKNGFDYGWGTYNQVTHNLLGDSIFILKLSTGVYKKIIIESLIGDKTYNVKYADLNGSNETTIVVDKEIYKDKIYVYYSFANKQLIDREPKRSDWDITFTQYNTITQNQNYTVMGVLVNNKNSALKVLNDTTVNSYFNKNFTSNMSEIGFDWKLFDLATNKWTIYSANSYFINTGNQIFKINFTGFGGSGTGRSNFSKSLVTNISTNTLESQKSFEKIKVFPNPCDGNIVNIELKSVTEVKTLNVVIRDIAGREIIREVQNINGNESSFQLLNLNLTPGAYFVSISGDNYFDTIKLLVK